MMVCVFQDLYCLAGGNGTSFQVHMGSRNCPTYSLLMSPTNLVFTWSFASCVCGSVLSQTRENVSADFSQSSLSVQFLPLWHFPQIIGALASLKPDLCVLNSARPLGSFGPPFLLHVLETD